MEERLRYILSVTNEWLRFAEAKNAALLAASSASFFTVLNLLANPQDKPDPTWVFNVALALMAGSAIVSLVSFLPKLVIPQVLTAEAPPRDPNLLFFGHAAMFEPQAYIEALYACSGIQCYQHNPLEKSYAVQIVINSQIANHKFRMFNVGVFLMSVAVVILVVSRILTLIR